MRNVYLALDAIQQYLQGHSQINMVTYGDIFEVDLKKQTIFPLAHLYFENATIPQQVVQFQVGILFMDIVDETKQDVRNQNEPFYGVNNVMDIHNTMLAVANGLIQEIRKGTLWDEGYELVGDPSLQPFQDRFENSLAGWNMTLSINTKNNEISIC
jgi:hypothetical protein